MDDELARWLEGLPRQWVDECSPTLFAAAKAAYGTPGRHYHTWDHVVACVDELRTFPGASRSAFLALVFHDAVFIPGSPDNERLSAALARSLLSQHARLTAGELAAVDRMILATASHEARPDLPDEELAMLDIDLATLAAPRDEYERYAGQIRREYCPAAMSPGKFREGRARFLRSMLARARVYVTPEGRRRWEDRARANMVAELAELESGRGPIRRLIARIIGR